MKAIAKLQKKEFLQSMLKLDKNVTLIKEGNTQRLPQPINDNVYKQFTLYSTHNIEKINFNTFLNR